MISVLNARRIEAVLGTKLTGVHRLSGGSVADVHGGDLADIGPVVIKTGQGLDVEGRMLRYLARETQLPVPAVHHAEGALLVMERLPGTPGLAVDAQSHGAELLAELHALTAPRYGLDFETMIGGLPQDNEPSDDWIAFFANRRLRAMAGAAVEAGRLPSEMETRVARLADQLDRWIDAPAPPSLVHGDAWAGNILSEGGRVTAFVDPAIYYADPEIELAFGTLFDTFDGEFFARYAEIRSIRDGFFEVRRDIYNLYPLLVHVRLFGGTYVGAVDRTLRQYGF